jgi:hypothetical protein
MATQRRGECAECPTNLANPSLPSVGREDGRVWRGADQRHEDAVGLAFCSKKVGLKSLLASIWSCTRSLRVIPPPSKAGKMAPITTQ